MTNIELLMTSLAGLNMIKTGLFLFIAEAAYYTADWDYGLLTCKVVSKTGAVTYAMTEFILVFLTRLHYKVVVTEQFYADRSRKFACFAFATALFTVSGIMSVPGFYDWDVTNYSIRKTTLLDLGVDIASCNRRNASGPICVVRICELNLKIKYATYILIVVLIIMLFPVIYFITTFIKLRRTLKTALEKVRANMSTLFYRIRLEGNNKLLAVLAITWCGFTLSYVPVLTLHFTEYMEVTTIDEKFRRLYAWYTFLFFILTAVDTCSTPLAYLVVHPSFRRMLRKVVCCRRRTCSIKRRKNIAFKENKAFTVESTSQC